MPRLRDVLAVLILVGLFLLGLYGNEVGDGQPYLLIVVGVVGVLFMVWLLTGFRTQLFGLWDDWQALAVAQARKRIKTPEDVDDLDIATALLALQRRDYKTASAILWLTAERGNSRAQYFLSGLFKRGRGVPRCRSEALKWLHRAADGGVAEAQSELGEYYLTGEGHNVLQALIWFESAADQGDRLSQHRLGTIHDKGIGIRRDSGTAADWYRKAAERGYDKAQRALGQLYMKGRGVPKDPVQAYAWLRLAAEQGDGKANRDLLRANTMLSPEERSSSDWLVSQWQDRIAEIGKPMETRAEQRLRRRRERKVETTVSIVDRIRATMADGIMEANAAANDSEPDVEIIGPAEDAAGDDAADSRIGRPYREGVTGRVFDRDDAARRRIDEISEREDVAASGRARRDGAGRGTENDEPDREAAPSAEERRRQRAARRTSQEQARSRGRDKVAEVAGRGEDRDRIRDRLSTDRGRDDAKKRVDELTADRGASRGNSAQERAREQARDAAMPTRYGANAAAKGASAQRGSLLDASDGDAALPPDVELPAAKASAGNQDNGDGDERMSSIARRSRSMARRLSERRGERGRSGTDTGGGDGEAERPARTARTSRRQEPTDHVEAGAGDDGGEQGDRASRRGGRAGRRPDTSAMLAERLSQLPDAPRGRRRERQ